MREPPRDVPRQHPAALDAARLAGISSELRQQYLSAAPWPHVVVHDVFDATLLDMVVDELSAINRTGMDSAQTRNMVKRETANTDLLGGATLAVLDALNSPTFVSFVANVTGISGLQPDPERRWGGVHETPTGGYTNIHTDFERHPATGLYHRTNVLLYLNRGWQEDWGGFLEMWPASMVAVGRRVLPEYNTLVLFETNAQTMHGLPEPVAAPDGRSRLSLAAYQYSEQPPKKTARRRLSKYARRPNDPWRVGVPTKWDIRERVPKRVLAGLRRLRK
jgi:hypothetical protein